MIVRSACSPVIDSSSRAPSSIGWIDLGSPRARFAAYFRELSERVSPGGRELPLSAFVGAVYAARQLASDALDAEPVPDLEALGEDLQIWMSDLFR